MYGMYVVLNINTIPFQKANRLLFLILYMEDRVVRTLGLFTFRSNKFNTQMDNKQKSRIIIIKVSIHPTPILRLFTAYFNRCIEMNI